MYKTPQPILQRIKEAKTSQAEELNLSDIIWNYRAPQLPPEVLQLSQLKRLICNNQALSILPQALNGLTQLESVDIRHNPIHL